jgi:ribosomal protein L37AE/L43A
MFNEIIKESFFSELKKIATAHYKCPNCGYDNHESEDGQTGTCSNCGTVMRDGPGYDTRQNS